MFRDLIEGPRFGGHQQQAEEPAGDARQPVGLEQHRELLDEDGGISVRNPGAHGRLAGV